MSERPKMEPLPIPDNFNGTFNFFGFNFKTINFMEGVFLAVIFGGILFWFTYYILYLENIGVIAAFTAAGIAGGMFLGIKGINCDPIHTYIKHVFQQFVNRRKTQYNPRVKYEITYALTLAEEAKKDVTIGVENKSIFQQYMAKIGVNAPQMKQHAFTSGPEETSNFIFEDDIGIVERSPEEIKKQIAKNNKKQAKKNLLKKKGGILDVFKGKGKKGKKAAKGN